MNFFSLSPLYFFLIFGYQNMAIGLQTKEEKDKRIVELQEQIAGKEKQPAEQVFKNIEIFEGQPAIRLLRIMEFAFTRVLSVDCTHCHVEGKWESDEKKPKLIAREMWNMVGEINKRVRKAVGEKSAANCYTCHRGQLKPALSPPSKE